MRSIEILMVEDNPDDIELTRERLAQAKIYNRLQVVEDGELAMDYLRRKGPYQDIRRPDLILLDLNLPKKDGMQVLREIKEDSELARIPVVILTSSDADEDIIRSYELHANAYVRKPIDLAGYRKIVAAIDDFWFALVHYSPSNGDPHNM